MGAIVWADIIAASNLIVATTAAVIALFSPIIAWRLTRRGQAEDQKRQVKMNIFGALMENRPSSQSTEAVRALNLIDVAFHDNPTVRRLWREYHGMITKSSFVHSEVGFELVKQKMEELQAAMAVDLGFGVDRFDVERIYQPNWLVEEDNLRMNERQARLAALQGKSINRAVSGSAVSSEKEVLSNIYLAYYNGFSQDRGYAFIYINDGKILGSDMVGVVYNGEYELHNGRLIGKAKMSVPAGVMLVTGHTSDKLTEVPIDINFSQNFAAGERQNINILGREVAIFFRKVSV